MDTTDRGRVRDEGRPVRTVVGACRAHSAIPAIREARSSIEVPPASHDGRSKRVMIDLRERSRSEGRHVRILVIEDEQKVARALRQGLEGERYEVEVATTGEDGFFRALSRPFDVVVLDLMLPGRSGLDVLATLRRQGDRTPVLVLTAKDTVEDRVAGLDGGADDYLVKPFAFAELLARLRALIRRGRPIEPLRLRSADLELDPPTRTATRGGEDVDLTAREYDLLEYLLRHEGAVVSREMLARDVWKEPSRGTPLDNVIDVHIARVRKKVDREGRAKLIHTIRGVGFAVRPGEP